MALKPLRSLPGALCRAERGGQAAGPAARCADVAACRFDLPLSEPLDGQSRLQRLKTVFQLSSFDLDLLLLALAPELDLRYERLYAYLQDDVTRRRPSVDLAFNLLCSSSADKLTRRAHLAATAPLRRHGLLSLLADPQQLQPPLLAHTLKLDSQIVAFCWVRNPWMRACCRSATGRNPPVRWTNCRSAPSCGRRCRFWLCRPGRHASRSDCISRDQAVSASALSPRRWPAC